MFAPFQANPNPDLWRLALEMNDNPDIALAVLRSASNLNLYNPDYALNTLLHLCPNLNVQDAKWKRLFTQLTTVFFPLLDFMGMKAKAVQASQRWNLVPVHTKVSTHALVFETDDSPHACITPDKTLAEDSRNHTSFTHLSYTVAPACRPAANGELPRRKVPRRKVPRRMPTRRGTSKLAITRISDLVMNRRSGKPSRRCNSAQMKQ